jgi:hypothetical protein
MTNVGLLAFAPEITPQTETACNTNRIASQGYPDATFLLYSVTTACLLLPFPTALLVENNWFQSPYGAQDHDQRQHPGRQDYRLGAGLNQLHDYPVEK